MIEKLIKDEQGATLIETLVSISLITLVVSLTLLVLASVTIKPRIVLKQEAVRLAIQETDRIYKQKIITDSVYTTSDNKFIVNREVKITGNLACSKLTIISNYDKDTVFVMENYYSSE